MRRPLFLCPGITTGPREESVDLRQASSKKSLWRSMPSFCPAEGVRGLNTGIRRTATCPLCVWWPSTPSGGCTRKTIDRRHAAPAVQKPSVAELTEVLKTSLPVVVVAHHPLATYGPHGGFFDWRDHLFPLTRLVTGLWIPLPVVGSLYPLIRWHLVRSEQDLIGSSNRAMRASLEKALASRANGKSPLIYAAGHDHSLQIMRGTVADYLLVSGLGSQSNATAVGHGDDTVFAHEHPGFVALDFTDQEIWLSAIEPVASGEQVVLRVPVPSS